jgi:epoxide hydrolase-like predicted phosphatase
MYKAICFDWTGVIFGYPGIKFSKAAAKIIGVSLEDFHRVYFTHNSKVNVDGIPLEDFATILSTELGKPNKKSAYINFVKNFPAGKLNVAMVSLIKTLKESGYKVGLLSNKSKQDGTNIRSYDFTKYFDSILISEEIGLMKPQKEAFEMLIKNLDILPREMIFIDDVEKNFSTASEVGYTPVLFTNYNALVKELTSLEVKL